MNPYDVLLKHEQLITLVVEHQYLPHHSRGDFLEVAGAMRQIDPHANFDFGCDGCISDLIKKASIHLNIHKLKLQQEKERLDKEAAVFHTFPKHDPPTVPEKRKPGRPRKQ